MAVAQIYYSSKKYLAKDGLEMSLYDGKSLPET